MLAQARVKTITLHTRKEAIAIFQELKNKINAAFQSQSTAALQSLLAIIKIIYYLSPFPKFLSEINSIGTLSVTFFLENLLIKSRMMKFAFSQDFQGWIISLLYKFKEDNPSLDLKEVKVLKEIQYDPEKYSWDIQQIIDFIHDSLQQSSKRNDYGQFGSTVLLLRNFLVYSDEKYSESLYTHIDWSCLVAYLTKGCWILNNILREETAICIIYFLCLKKHNLCRATLENGIVNYLLQTLNSKFISESFGRKIIEFLIYLLFYSEPDFLKGINFESFEDIISKFISRYNNVAVACQARNLVALLEKKFSINHEMKLERLNTLMESQHVSNEPEIIKNLSIILLYSQNAAMRELLLRSYPKLLKCLFATTNENITIMLLELLSICYKSGQLDVGIAETILSKIDYLISQENMKDKLNANHKRMLIDLVKILKTTLENTQFSDHVLGMVKYIGLEAKLWKWSDCANYQYEKQLIGLSEMLGTNHSQQAEANIFEKLQENFIIKSRTNLSKSSAESYEEIFLLDELIEKSSKPAQELNINPVLSLVVSSYIHGVSTTLPKLLGSLEKEDQEKLRKKVNLASCKLLLKLLVFKEDQHVQTKKLMELSASQDQTEETTFLVSNFFKANGTRQQSHHHNGHHKSHEEEALHKVKQLVADYFADPSSNSSFILGLTAEEIGSAIIEIQAYESQQSLIKTLLILTQIAKIERHCNEIFEKFSANLAIIYNYILSNPTEQQKEGLYLLESLLLLFIKTHIDQFFSDNFHDLNFWIEVLSSIDSYFEVYLTKKRILLLEHIFEFLQINRSFDLNNVTIMMHKNNRKESLKSQAFHNKGQTLGYCYSSLIPMLQLEDIQSIALQHKQNIVSILFEGSYLHVAKFVQNIYRYCSAEVFTDYNLQDWAEKAVKNIEKQLKKLQVILNQSSQGSRRLRILNYYIDLLSALNAHKQLTTKKSLLYFEQSILISCLKNIVYYMQAFQEGQFKKYYLGQLASKTMVALVNLYRNNFKQYKVRGGSVVDSFEYLLSINNQEIKTAVCEMMRVLLLKKEVKMMDCAIYSTCKEFKQSLSPSCQQQIFYCQHIEHILYEGGQLEQQLDLYFENTANNRQMQVKETVAEVIIPSAYLIEDQYEQIQQPPIEDKQQVEPIFLQFASERQGLDGGTDKSILYFQSKKQVENIEQSPIKQTTSIIIAKQISQPRQQQLEKSSSLIEKLEAVWSQQQLLSKIQQYLQNPQTDTLKEINNHLVPINSQKYYSLLVRLFLKANNQHKNSSIASFHQIQTNIIQNIPSQFCEADEPFYEVLSSGIPGSRIGLKCKNIGLKGLEIYAKKFMNSLKTEDMVNYAELLSSKKNFDELKYLKNCKIYQLINDKLPVFVKNSDAMLHLGRLVAETCKYPPLCNSYEITGSLCSCIVNEILEPASRKEVLNTIRNLAKFGEKHKLKVQNSEFLSELITMLEGSEGEEMSSIAELMFLGAQDCKQSAQLYQQLNLEEMIMAILQKLLAKDYYHCETYLHLLKILECLSILPQSSARMLRGGFMTLCNPITQLSIKQGDFQLIGILVNILRGMLQEMELNLSKVVNDLQKDGFIAYLLSIGPYVPKSKQVESYLGIYSKIMPHPAISKKILVHLQEILNIMSDLARDQLLTQFLLQLWMKVLFLFLQSNRYALVPQILKSNIFFSAANSLRPFLSISDKIINMNSRMSKELDNKGEIKGSLAIHGYADFLVQILRMINLPLDEYRRILDNLSQLHRHRPFPRKLCTQLFAVVIIKLQTHWKDDIALSSVTLLKAIRRKVEVTAQFGANMLDFFGKFLTQSSKISSPEYYAVSKEVICLLSHFLLFNEEIRFLFRTELVVNILKNWVRIARAMKYDEMDQVFKLFYYSLYSAHGLYVDLCGTNSKRLAQAEHDFEKGWQCMLYRLNGTYKNAVVKIDKSKQEIIAYKNPDGVVKDKYRIHFKELLVIQNYQRETDILFAQSVFPRSINIFQHKAPPPNCLTLIGLTQNFEVREISIEAESRQQRLQIQLDTSLLVSRWHQGQIEEESRAWQLINSKLP